MNFFFPMLHFLFPFGIFPFVLQARNLKLETCFHHGYMARDFPHVGSFLCDNGVGE